MPGLCAASSSTMRRTTSKSIDIERNGMSPNTCEEQIGDAKQISRVDVVHETGENRHGFDDEAISTRQGRRRGPSKSLF